MWLNISGLCVKFRHNYSGLKYVACSSHTEVFRALKTQTIIFSLTTCLLFFDEEYKPLTAKKKKTHPNQTSFPQAVLHC